MVDTACVDARRYRDNNPSALGTMPRARVHIANDSESAAIQRPATTLLISSVSRRHAEASAVLARRPTIFINAWSGRHEYRSERLCLAEEGKGERWTACYSYDSDDPARRPMPLRLPCWLGDPDVVAERHADSQARLDAEKMWTKTLRTRYNRSLSSCVY